MNASIGELKELIHAHKLYIPLELVTIKRVSVMVDPTIEEVYNISYINDQLLKGGYCFISENSL